MKTIGDIQSADIATALGIHRVETFIADAERQMDQIRRRVVRGESIPHHEKVFSLFQRHTEWISKGKAGVPVELGLKVCVRQHASGKGKAENAAVEGGRRSQGGLIDFIFVEILEAGEMCALFTRKQRNGRLSSSDDRPAEEKMKYITL